MSDLLIVGTAWQRLDAAIGRGIDGRAEPRTAFGEAAGLATAGVRVTLSLDANGLAACGDLVAQAIERGLPLVLRVDARDDHAVLHAVAARGGLVLSPIDAQDAVDLALVARRTAEFALQPVVIATDLDEDLRCEVELPSPAVLRRVLGDAGDDIGTPTNAQRMTLGERRRRLPRRFDLERPVLLGATHLGRVRDVVRASHAPYVATAVLPSLGEALAEIARATGRELLPVVAHKASDAQVTIVAAASLSRAAIEAADRLREAHHKVGVLALRVLSPIPIAELLAALRGQRAVVTVERQEAGLGAAPPLRSALGTAVGEALHNGALGRRGDHGRPAWRAADAPALAVALVGPGTSSLRSADLVAFVGEIASGGARRQVRLGVDYAPRGTRYPKRQALFDRLRRDQPELTVLGLRAASGSADAAGSASARGAAPVSRTMRQLVLPLARTSDAHDSLPRFMDQVGVLYQSGESDELAPDPYFAQPSVPPLASSFGRPGASCATLPSLDAAKCTACGACYTGCPDGAIAPLAIGARALLEAGIERAKAQGRPADALRMLVGKLASKVQPSAAPTVAAALQSAFDAVIGTAAPDGERRQALVSAFDAVRDAVGVLPSAMQAAPFDAEFFTLVIDPDACKACGACVALCEPQALTTAPRTPDAVAAARATWATFEALPDTSGELIARVRQAGELGAAATLGLSRHAVLSMSPGDAAGPGSGARLALRLVLGAVEAHGQPRVVARRAEIASLQEEFGKRIHAALGKALPDADLDALAEGLHTLGRADVALGELADRVGQVVDSGRVDARALERLVTAARSLTDLHWRLGRGASGLGRARAGLVIVPCRELAWACAFPDNPFPIPVVTGDASLARGVLSGQIEAWLDELRIVRSARLELERPGAAQHASAQSAVLGFADLSDEERAACPPLLVVGSARELAGAGLADVGALLRSRLPVLVVALASEDEMPDLALHALAWRDAFVAQCSVGAADHLVESVGKALRSGRSALLCVHAPEPAAGGFAADQTVSRAQAAIATRRFPLLTFDPSRPGVFGSRLDLAGNPKGDSATTTALESWRVLRELSGAETPFTASVRDGLERELAARHAAELAALRGEADARVAAARAAVEGELAERLRTRLVGLAARGRA